MYTSKDGSQFTNAMAGRKNDARLANAADMKPKMPMPSDDHDTEQNENDITGDPKAMKLVGELSAMGYDADDYSKACGNSEDKSADHSETSDDNMAGLQSLPGLK